MESARAFFRLLGQAPRRDAIMLGMLMLLSSATEGFGFLLLVPLLQSISTETATMGGEGNWYDWLAGSLSVGALLFIFVALVGLRSLIQFMRETLSTRIQHQVVDCLRLEAITMLLNVEWRWFIAQRGSDFAGLLLTNIGRVGVGLNFGISLMASLILIVGYLTVAMLVAPLLVAFVTVIAGPVCLLLSRLYKTAYQLGQENSLASRALHGSVQESLSGIRLAKILSAETRLVAAMQVTIKRLRENQQRFVASSSLNRSLFQFGAAAMLAVFVYLCVTIFAVDIPALLTLVLIFSRLVPMVMAAQAHFHQWLNALPALEETEVLLAQGRTVTEPGLLVETQALTLHDGIRFEEVSLRHDARERAAIEKVSLFLPARTTTAVIGASGAGKSTLADILMGLLVPDSGRVLVDGASLEGAARREWRRSVAYVPQDTFLFHDSIRNNLLYGNADATEADIEAALRKAAAEFVFDLPGGIDAIVGDGGQRLSGGERQRLAFARALLRRPALLILDEATSALDLASEARIREVIEQLHGDLTVLIIGHRLPTLEHADLVVRLDRGRVVAMGTWDEVKSADQTKG